MGSAQEFFDRKISYVDTNSAKLQRTIQEKKKQLDQIMGVAQQRAVKERLAAQQAAGAPTTD